MTWIMDPPVAGHISKITDLQESSIAPAFFSKKSFYSAHESIDRSTFRRKARNVATQPHRRPGVTRAL